MNPEEEHPLNALMEQASGEERKKQVYSQKALRTLEGDIQEAIQKRNASAASMVMAEQVKVSSSPVKKQSSNLGKKLMIVLASIALISIGVGGAYYLYLQSPLAPSAPAMSKPTPIPSIVYPDAQKTLDITGLASGVEKTAVESALSNVANGNGSLLQIIPVEKATDGTKTIVSASDFLTSIGLPAPDILFRSLNPQWMLGTYNENGTAAPFVLFTDNFFQNAYAGMIAWESTMPDNFADIFSYADKASRQNGTSTLASFFTIQGNFKDGVIENKDVRAFTGPDGTVFLLYSFVNNNTIVITTDGNALSEIINRLEKQTFIR